MKNKVVMILLPLEMHEKCKDLGINMSQVARRAIKQRITIIEDGIRQRQQAERIT